MFRENDYSDFNGKWFVFDGQNASTGEPNKITGRMSFYGRFYGFGIKKEAKDFAEKIYDSNASVITKVGTARTLRKYALGSSVDDYLENLKYTFDLV